MQMDVRRAAEEESSLRRQQHQVVLSNRGNGGVGGDAHPPPNGAHWRSLCWPSPACLQREQKCQGHVPRFLQNDRKQGR